MNFESSQVVLAPVFESRQLGELTKFGGVRVVIGSLLEQQQRQRQTCIIVEPSFLSRKIEALMWVRVRGHAFCATQPRDTLAFNVKLVNNLCKAMPQDM